MTFTVYQDEAGTYRWRLADAKGKLIKITPGGMPGLRNSKSYAAAGRNVQAALKRVAEQQAQGVKQG